MKGRVGSERVVRRFFMRCRQNGKYGGWEAENLY